MAGENLASKFKATPARVWEWRIASPPASLQHAKLNVEMRDRQGNAARIERPK
jgi:hypothetical protein